MYFCGFFVSFITTTIMARKHYFKDYCVAKQEKPKKKKPLQF